MARSPQRVRTELDGEGRENPTAETVDASGISARTRVPAPAGSRRSACLESGDAVEQAREPAARWRARAADAVVLDVSVREQSVVPVAVIRAPSRHWRTWRHSSVPRQRRSRPPTRPRWISLVGDVDAHRQRRAIRERLDGGRQPATGEQRRVDAVGELAQLLDRRARCARAPRRRAAQARAERRQGVGQLQGDDRVDEPLLSAVVEVADDASALLIGGGNDPGAGRKQLGAARWRSTRRWRSARRSRRAGARCRRGAARG